MDFISYLNTIQFGFPSFCASHHRICIFNICIHWNFVMGAKTFVHHIKISVNRVYMAKFSLHLSNNKEVVCLCEF